MARQPRPAKPQPAKPQPAKSGETPSSGKAGRPLWTALLLLPVFAVLLPSCLVLGAALAPSAVAYMIDRGRAKHLAITVGLTNLCGALPAVVALWSKGQTYTATLEIAGGEEAADGGISRYKNVSASVSHYTVFQSGPEMIKVTTVDGAVYSETWSIQATTIDGRVLTFDMASGEVR